MILRLFLVLAVVLGPTFSASAYARVILFEKDQPVRFIEADFQLSSGALETRSGKLNKGLAIQETVNFLRAHQKALGLEAINSEALPMRKLHASKLGLTFRFVQRFNRVSVDGGELLAIFSRSGTLTALNSSLLRVSSFDITPELTSREALARAVKALRYQDPELGKDSKDGLLITTARRRPLLVWQFSLRERKTKLSPAIVHVVAAGPGAGKILRVVSLARAARANVLIFDAIGSKNVGLEAIGAHVLDDGELVGGQAPSREALDANQNFSRARDFYGQSFDRWSFDGQGAPIIASVNVEMVEGQDFRENAAWAGPFNMFIFGAGSEQLGGFAGALEVVAHEYTHAVIDNTSNLDYFAESGGLNEHLADVFGASVRQQYERPANPFVIGASTLRGQLRSQAEGLRDMLNPERGVMPQPRHMRQMPADMANCVPDGDNNDNCYVHDLSGIPNRAAALIIQGLGWETAGQLFYRVMTGRLRSNSNFLDYRNQVVAECKSGLAEDRCEAVRAAFADVGL